MIAEIGGKPDVFAAAIQWVQAALLGSLATATAAIAVAAVGFLMLSGRVDVRLGVRVVFGCFVLFGASSIAGGIFQLISGGGAAPDAAPSLPPSAIYVSPVASPVAAVSQDPYAGAALPPGR